MKFKSLKDYVEEILIGGVDNPTMFHKNITEYIRLINLELVIGMFMGSTKIFSGFEILEIHDNKIRVITSEKHFITYDKTINKFMGRTYLNDVTDIGLIIKI